MVKYSWLILTLLGFSLSYNVMADEGQQKTDGSFVGEDSDAPINSSFVGDISNSTVNESWGHEDIQKKTDSEFVGTDPGESGNSYFAGENGYQQQVANSTDGAFAGDGTFVGKDYGK
jgi:hypothetical protein